MLVFLSIQYQEEDAQLCSRYDHGSMIVIVTTHLTNLLHNYFRQHYIIVIAHIEFEFLEIQLFRRLLSSFEHDSQSENLFCRFNVSVVQQIVSEK